MVFQRGSHRQGAWAARPILLQPFWCSRTRRTGTGTSSWCWMSSCQVQHWYGTMRFIVLGMFAGQPQTFQQPHIVLHVVSADGTYEHCVPMGCPQHLSVNVVQAGCRGGRRPPRARRRCSCTLPTPTCCGPMSSPRRGWGRAPLRRACRCCTRRQALPWTQSCAEADQHEDESHEEF
jgi:hypothetical protein